MLLAFAAVTAIAKAIVRKIKGQLSPVPHPAIVLAVHLRHLQLSWPHRCNCRWPSGSSQRVRQVAAAVLVGDDAAVGVAGLRSSAAASKRHCSATGLPDCRGLAYSYYQHAITGRKR